jgi:hypothetical protein
MKMPRFWGQKFGVVPWTSIYQDVKRRVEPLDFAIEQYIGFIILHLVLTFPGGLGWYQKIEIITTNHKI